MQLLCIVASPSVSGWFFFCLFCFVLFFFWGGGGVVCFLFFAPSVWHKKFGYLNEKTFACSDFASGTEQSFVFDVSVSVIFVLLIDESVFIRSAMIVCALYLGMPLVYAR